MSSYHHREMPEPLRTPPRGLGDRLLAGLSPVAGLAPDEAAAVEAERRALNLRRARFFTPALAFILIVSTALVFRFVAPTSETQRVWLFYTLVLNTGAIA